MAEVSCESDWCHMASLGHNELTESKPFWHQNLTAMVWNMHDKWFLVFYQEAFQLSMQYKY